MVHDKLKQLKRPRSSVFVRGEPGNVRVERLVKENLKRQEEGRFKHLYQGKDV